MQEDIIEPGIGMAVSGGGFRATLFHLGAFWRLNELGLLSQISRICSVSGGSITAGLLGLHWKNLDFSKDGVAINFKEEIVNPLRKFCLLNIDVPSIFGGWLSVFKSASEMLVDRYQKHLYGDATLQDFPSKNEGPIFVIYATSLQTGVSVRLSKPYIGEYTLGLLRDPHIKIAKAVTASSAFPPVLSPVLLKTDPNKWEQVNGSYLYNEKKMRQKIYLSDGGVYDNLGLESVWNRYSTVLVSDAGAPFKIQKKPWLLNYSQFKKLLRVLNIAVEQTRALRKRRLIDDFKKGVRKGTYWGIATHINDYELNDSMVFDNDLTSSLKTIRTRLNSFSEKEQGHLINWGYALADSALRKHVLTNSMSPGNWPVSEFPLNK
jgi:NTE family protein